MENFNAEQAREIMNNYDNKHELKPILKAIKNRAENGYHTYYYCGTITQKTINDLLDRGFKHTDIYNVIYW
jgi:hypothetical protein